MKDRRLEALMRKMGNYPTKISKGDASGRSFALTKRAAHDYFKAKKNKKKLPELKKAETKKNPEYAKMTIEGFESRYMK